MKKLKLQLLIEKEQSDSIAGCFIKNGFSFTCEPLLDSTIIQKGLIFTFEDEVIKVIDFIHTLGMENITLTHQRIKVIENA